MRWRTIRKVSESEKSIEKAPFSPTPKHKHTEMSTSCRIHPTASALSSTFFFKHHLLRPRVVFNHHTRRRLFTTMASAPLHVCVKSSFTVPNKLGDCPFCQRVLLTLEEKHLPYELKLVDLANKPEWFLKINAQGRVPVVKLDEEWIADSDIITQTLEDKYPDPPLTTPPDKASVGSKIFSTFISFVKSKNPKDGTEQALLDELSAFNDYLKEHGPFVNGEKVSSVDLSLVPKLYHMEIALGEYKDWSVPDSLPYVKSYMKSLFSRDSFSKTRALKEDVIAGWRAKVLG